MSVKNSQIVEPKKIAVVILNWNGKALLEKFLPSVVQYSDLATIYVADNASTDDSISFLQTHFPQVKRIVNTVNGGYAKGYNDCLQFVEEAFYCLLNNDVEVTEGWLDPILQHFETEPSTGILQPKIRDYKKPEYFEYAGAAGGYLDKYGFPFCRGRIFNTVEKDEGQYDDSTSIFWATGACFFIRKSLYRKLKGFDELFFAHMEEIDLCWRAHNLGYTTKYIGTSMVYHLGGGTLNAVNPRKTYLNFRNSLFTLTKNAPKSPVFLILSRMVLDGLAAFKYLTEFKLQHIFAILKAHLSFYIYLPKIVKDRHLQQKNWNPKNTPDYYRIKSIVWQYFIKKNRKFRDL